MHSADTDAVYSACVWQTFPLRLSAQNEVSRSNGPADSQTVSKTREEPPLYAYATKQQNLHLFVHGQKVQMMTEYQTYFRNEKENENYAVLYYENENEN